MKALVLVDSVAQVPDSIRQKLYVISANNWQESFHFLAGKTTSQYLYFHDTAPVERLLKLVEEYQGDLAVYTAQNIDSVMLSRFTRVVSRRKIEIAASQIEAFLKGSELEQTLKDIKKVL